LQRLVAGDTGVGTKMAPALPHPLGSALDVVGSVRWRATVGFRER
jgi:hypothetical protein